MFKRKVFNNFYIIEITNQLVYRKRPLKFSWLHTSAGCLRTLTESTIKHLPPACISPVFSTKDHNTLLIGYFYYFHHLYLLQFFTVFKINFDYCVLFRKCQAPFKFCKKQVYFIDRDTVYAFKKNLNCYRYFPKK